MAFAPWMILFWPLPICTRCAASSFVPRASCTSSTGFTITSQSDIDSGPIFNCGTVYGDIILDNASGNLTFYEAGVQNVHGNIYLRNNAAVQYLQLDGILQIESSLTIQSATALVYLSTDNDITLLPNFALQDVPKLGSVYHNITEMATLDITNTGLAILGLDALETVTNLTIVNNPKMNTVSFSFYNLVNVTGNWLVANNSVQTGGVSINAPKLIFMNNAIWQGLGEIQDVGILETVNNSLELSDSFSMFKDAKFPSLTRVGKQLVIRNNPGMNIVELTSLQSVGDLIIENNPSLEDPGVFEELANASSITLIGGFSEARENCFPILLEVSGSVYVNSSASTPFDCKTFEALNSEHKILGNLTCNGNGTPGPGLSKGAKAGISVGAALGGLFLLAALIATCRRMGKEKPVDDLPAFAQTGRFNVQKGVYERP